MLVVAIALWATGLPDRWGFEGASQGLGIGAAVAAPLWLHSLYRRSRPPRETDEP